MAHASIELNKKMHGRICVRGMNALLQHNRDDTIARQEKEIQTLKRKLVEERGETQFYKISRNNLIDEKEDLTDRLTHTRRFMRDNFDAVRDYMDTCRRSGSLEEAYWRNAYNSLQEAFDIVTNVGEDDSEESDSE